MYLTPHMSVLHLPLLCAPEVPYGYDLDCDIDDNTDECDVVILLHVCRADLCIDTTFVMLSHQFH